MRFITEYTIKLVFCIKYSQKQFKAEVICFKTSVQTAVVTHQKKFFSTAIWTQHTSDESDVCICVSLNVANTHTITTNRM